MKQDFYKDVLSDRSINVIIPDKKSVEKIYDIINKELILGKIEESVRHPLNFGNLYIYN